MKSLSATSLLCAFLLTAMCAASAADLSGAWVLSMSGPNGETLKFPMELKVKDKTLEGRVDRGGERWLELTKGKVDGSKISFVIERDRPEGGTMVYAMTGEFADSQLQGETKTEFQGQEMSAKWSAVRAKVKASEIDGEWILHLKDPNGGDVEFPMEFKVAAQTLTGRVGRGDGRWMTVTDGKVEGTAFSFTVKRDRPGGGSMVYKMAGKPDAGKLKGTATTTMDGSGEVTVDWNADRPAK